ASPVVSAGRARPGLRLPTPANAPGEGGWAPPGPGAPVRGRERKAESWTAHTMHGDRSGHRPGCGRVAGILVPDALLHAVSQFVIRLAGAQRCQQVVALPGEQAGIQMAVGGQPQSIATRAERPGYRGYHPQLVAVFKAVEGRRAGAARQRL